MVNLPLLLFGGLSFFVGSFWGMFVQRGRDRAARHSIEPAEVVHASFTDGFMQLRIRERGKWSVSRAYDLDRESASRLLRVLHAPVR